MTQRLNNKKYFDFKKSVRTLLFSFLLLAMAGCATKRHLTSEYNLHNFPIDDISILFDKKIENFLEVREAKRYIIFKNYDFFLVDYNGSDSSINTYTMAVSKDKSTFFLLNYPERFSFNNFNKIIRSEKYNLKNEVYTALYIKFFSSLFIPDSYVMDEVENAIKDGRLENDQRLYFIASQYPTEILKKFKDGNNVYIVNFYTLSEDTLLYYWHVELKEDGTVTACSVIMMLLNNDFRVTEHAEILNINLDSAQEQVVEDPSFYSP